VYSDQSEPEDQSRRKEREGRTAQRGSSRGGVYFGDNFLGTADRSNGGGPPMQGGHLRKETEHESCDCPKSRSFNDKEQDIQRGSTYGDCESNHKREGSWR
jgi:hypothetical protein